MVARGKIIDFIVRKLALLASLIFAGLTLAGCGAPGGPVTATPSQVEALEVAFLAMGDTVDPAEAARAAEVTYLSTRQQALAYEITDAPLIHNIKVNHGLRPRGLCYQWADDLEARLRAENFQTLEIHRAIANSENAILIEHSTVILSSHGDTMQDGVVLDGWRYGGDLFWAPFDEDTRYGWVARQDVFAMKRARVARVARRAE